MTLPIFLSEAHHHIDLHDPTSGDLRFNSMSVNKSQESSVYMSDMCLPPLLGFSEPCLVETPYPGLAGFTDGTPAHVNQTTLEAHGEQQSGHTGFNSYPFGVSSLRTFALMVVKN